MGRRFRYRVAIASVVGVTSAPTRLLNRASRVAIASTSFVAGCSTRYSTALAPAMLVLLDDNDRLLLLLDRALSLDGRLLLVFALKGPPGVLLGLGLHFGCLGGLFCVGHWSVSVRMVDFRSGRRPSPNPRHCARHDLTGVTRCANSNGRDACASSKRYSLRWP